MTDRHHYQTGSPTTLTCELCGVIVDSLKVEAYTGDCPAPLCGDPSNHDEPCVFVPIDAAGNMACAYCDRPGDPAGLYDGSDWEFDWLPVDDEDEEDNDSVTW